MVPKVHIMDVTTNSDVPYRFKLTVDEKPGLTKVTLYDRRDSIADDGKVVGVYYANGLLQIEHGCGMNAYDSVGGVHQIDGPTMWYVQDWLNRQLDTGVWF